MPKVVDRPGRKHRLALKNLQARQKDFDVLSSDKKDGRKRPGSMSGRK